MPKDVQMTEAQAFLSKHPDIETIEMLMPDMCGILRGKRLARDSFDKLFSGTVRAPGSIYLLDATGRSIPTIHYGIADGDPDNYCIPVLGTLSPVPWSKRPMGQVLASMTDDDGAPLFSDPRRILAEVVKRYADSGLTATVAIELEFYLLDQQPDADGRPQIAASPHSGYRQATTQVYGIDELYDFDEFLIEVENTCAIQGIPAEAATKEYGAGQYEMNLHYSSDPLAVCDNAVLLKRAIKAVARRHGIMASFMAKPFEDRAGNGLHVHVSVQDRNGRNIFIGAEDPVLGMPIGDNLRHAAAGLIGTMAEGVAIFAPNANSYRRFRPGVFAPVSPAWGINNRSSALRVPPSEPEALRIEHRPSGADANPYLVVAAVLAGMHHGITNKLQAPPLSEGDKDPEGLPELPLNWWSALNRFNEGTILRGYFGEQYWELYEACRRYECDSYHAQIQPLDYEWYMRPV